LFLSSFQQFFKNLQEKIMANAAANELSTAKNARAIDRKATNAVSHIQSALKELQEIVELIEKGETEAEFKTPEFNDLVGMLKVAKRSTIFAGMPWSGYATARAEKY
jgi:hypothetical protein